VDSTRLSKKEYFLQMLQLVAARSTCVRRSVGAIITNYEGHILSTGYNGTPKFFEHCTINPCAGAGDKPGDTSSCLAVHAEQNAILQCSNIAQAYAMYVSCTPCFVCSKIIANTEIQRVICEMAYADTRGLDVLIKAGIDLEISGIELNA
jgi:dCMP deaminase